jgi:hypothetical protein
MPHQGRKRLRLAPGAASPLSAARVGHFLRRVRSARQGSRAASYAPGPCRRKCEIAHFCCLRCLVVSTGLVRDGIEHLARIYVLLGFLDVPIAAVVDAELLGHGVQQGHNLSHLMLG